MEKKSQKLYTIEDLECILEHIPYEVWMKDKDGNYIYVNERGANKWGLKRGDIIGKKDEDIRPKEFCPKCDLTDKIVMESKKEIFYEHEFHGKEEEYYRVYKFPIKNREDEVKLIGGFSNEHKYSKNINEELKNLLINDSDKNEKIEYTQALEKILKNLGNMIKSTSINLFLVDKDGKNLKSYLSCNKNNLFSQNTNIKIDYETFSKLYNNKLELNINNSLNYEFEKRYTNKYKLYQKGKLKIFPLKIKDNLMGLMYIYYEDKNKCTEAYDGVITDICSQISILIENIEYKNKLRNKLYKSEEKTKHLQYENEKLEEAIGAEIIKVNFLENMSHEFRTPINIILMTSQLLLSSIEDNKIDLSKEKIIKYLKTLKQNGYRILRLVNNILDTTKFDNGYEELNMANYNIINIIEEIVLSTADYINNKNKNITFDTEEEEVILSCNPDAIEKIILNLISNSLKFTDDNGKIDVEIKVNHQEEKLFVHVRNNGPSISEEDSKKIFDRFVQTDNNIRRKNEGSGIGLYLVKCMVEMHGGKIWLNTNVESGVEFIFYIPIKQESNEKALKQYSIEEHSKIDKCNIEFSDVYSI